MREMQRHMGVKSVHGIGQYLAALQRKGWITWEPTKTRTVRPQRARIDS